MGRFTVDGRQPTARATPAAQSRKSEVQSQKPFGKSSRGVKKCNVRSTVWFGFSSWPRLVARGCIAVASVALCVGAAWAQDVGTVANLEGGAEICRGGTCT